MTSRSDLVLVIETASRPFSVALGRGQDILFDSTQDTASPHLTHLPDLVNYGLDVTAKTVNDITLIAVDIGPGGLSSVRSGVAFANGLAFGLKLPICSFLSFESLGFAAWQQFKVPILCSAKASEGNAYIGLFDQGKILDMRFGLLEVVAQKVTMGLNEFAVAGAHIHELSQLFDAATVHSSDMKSCQARTFIEMNLALAGDRVSDLPAVPLNEQSAIFHE
jgi:tRNA threonylcarbamoyladenosine biosynthesis protein TsaB